MPKTFTEEDDALLAQLEVEVEKKVAPARTAREERIIAGFEDIQRFFDEQGRAPQHGEDRDIFERLYAVRLDRIRELEECRTLVAPLDHQGLLDAQEESAAGDVDSMDDDALLAELGVEDSASDLTALKHVRSSADKKAADEIANRETCKDFETFKPMFAQVQKEIDAGIRETRPFQKDGSIETGDFFILGGQKAYVAAAGEALDGYDRENRRIRVIFDNGTENAYLLQSFRRALYKEENIGRRITDPTAGPLFSDRNAEGDEASGTIYVLRSLSDDPEIAAHARVLHKIGVTGGDVQKRIANAEHDATFLLAKVEVVATYELFNINRSRLENLIHRIFAPARFEMTITDRFGHPVTPREWFFAPLAAIDDAVEKIRSGEITNYIYDPKEARLVERPK